MEDRDLKKVYINEEKSDPSPEPDSLMVPLKSVSIIP